MGIKLFEYLRRIPGTTREQFHTYWSDVHAPMLANDPDLARHVTRYELNHRLPGDAERERTDTEVKDAEWDGVAVLWFDSMDELRALGREPGMQAIRDSAKNLHQDEKLIVITEEPDTILPSPRRDEAGAKMLAIVRRNAANYPDLDAFHEHWLKHHGGLFQTIPELRDPLWGYDQNHGLRDQNATFDGVTEQWFESLDSFIQSLSAPSFATEVNPDVATLLDPDNLHFVMVGKPTVVIG
jgi:EthD domain